VGVTVSNSGGGTPAQVGQWSSVLTWPLVAIHAVLLPNGQVLAWDGAAQGGAAFIWNPTTSQFTSVPPPSNIFCAGQCRLPDGRVFVPGGHIQNFVGLRDTNIFDPSTRTWQSRPPMTYGRWYPTAIVLPDGRVVVMAGETTCEGCTADIPEIYAPAADTWTRHGARRLRRPSPGRITIWCCSRTAPSSPSGAARSPIPLIRASPCSRPSSGPRRPRRGPRWPRW